MSSSSSSCSSFSDLSDIETVSNEISPAEMEALRKRIAELEIANERLTEEKMVREAKDSVEEESILKSIVGSWSMVSSVGMEEYLQRWKPSDIHDAIFRVGTQNFGIDADTVTQYDGIGTRKYYETTRKLGERIDNYILFIENNVLVSVGFQANGEEYCRLEKFVKNGQLHVVLKRFGMKCTRIYEKMNPEAVRSVVKLEAELEQLKIEMKENEKKLEAELEEKKKIIENAKKEVEVLEGKLETKTHETEYLEKELENRKNFLGRANNQIRQRNETIRENDKKMKELKEESEKDKEELERLREELEEKEEEIKVLKCNEEKKEELVPIETAIVGKWQIRRDSSGALGPHTIDFFMKDGSLHERITCTFFQTEKKVWGSNDPTETFSAHTFIENNQLVSDVKTDRSFWCRIERSVEKNVLTETINGLEDKITRVFDRVI